MSSATKYLTPEQAAEVCERSDLKAALLVAHAWALVFGSMAVFAIWPNVITFLLAVVIIGGRQLGLAILMHDGSHGVLFKTPKWNAFVTQWLCAYPVFADTWPYRKYHLVHHRYTQQAEDPDLDLSAPFPITKASFQRKVIRDITGQTAFKQRRSQVLAALGPADWSYTEREKLFLSKLGGPLVVNALLFGGLAAFGQWHLYFLLWLLPFVTWHQLIIRIRNIAEHAVLPDNADPLRNARTTLAGPILRTILAPYSVNYHVEHHMLMYVPCYNLPKFHRYLKENGWHEKMEIQPDYWTVLKMATSKLSDDDADTDQKRSRFVAGIAPVDFARDG